MSGGGFTWSSQHMSAKGTAPASGIVPYTKYVDPPDYDPGEVWYVPLAGGTPRRGSFPQRGNADSVPEVSYDGTQIAFSRNLADLRLVTVGAAAETLLRNATESGFGMRVRWKPDGAMVASVDGTQFPTVRNMLWVSDPSTSTKIYDDGSSAIGDFGYAYDGSRILAVIGSNLVAMDEDGTNQATIASSIAADSTLGRCAIGRVSDVVVYLNTSNELRRCAIDGSGDALIHTIGANAFRMAYHWMSWDDQHVVYVYDTSNGGGDGSPCDVIVVPVDGSGAVTTGVTINTEFPPGNLGNNPVDVPHVFGQRFYFTESADQFPDTGDPNPDVFVSYALAGTGRRVEDGGFVRVWGFGES